MCVCVCVCVAGDLCWSIQRACCLPHSDVALHLSALHVRMYVYIHMYVYVCEPAACHVVTIALHVSAPVCMYVCVRVCMTVEKAVSAFNCYTVCDL
jgi:hypothetical protein